MGNAADLQLSTDRPAEATTPDIAVDLAVLPVVSSAIAAGAVPVVSRLALTSADTTLRGATLRVSVQDGHGTLGAGVEQLVDLDAGRTTVLADASPVLDPAALDRAGDSRAGLVRVELESAGELLAECEVPVQVLAAGQWSATPLPLALELLAAHVQPDDPAVRDLLAEAAELLQEGTGDGSIAGYAGDAERADEGIEALTWAMRRRTIRYSEPPAGWSASGHDVRTPGEVLDGQAGTALDLVVTLAAACEHAGIRPLLWLVSGGAEGPDHAFLGYWREERSAD